MAQPVGVCPKCGGRLLMLMPREYVEPPSGTIPPHQRKMYEKAQKMRCMECEYIGNSLGFFPKCTHLRRAER